MYRQYVIGVAHSQGELNLNTHSTTQTLKTRDVNDRVGEQSYEQAHPYDELDVESEDETEDASDEDELFLRQ